MKCVIHNWRSCNIGLTIMENHTTLTRSPLPSLTTHLITATTVIIMLIIVVPIVLPHPTLPIKRNMMTICYIIALLLHNIKMTTNFALTAHISTYNNYRIHIIKGFRQRIQCDLCLHSTTIILYRQHLRQYRCVQVLSITIIWVLVVFIMPTMIIPILWLH